MNKKKIEKTLPLSDYVVLDLTIARAGPTAVRLLSDWGADVIRIEAPVEGDICLLYTSPSPRDGLLARMTSSA